MGWETVQTANYGAEFSDGVAVTNTMIKTEEGWKGWFQVTVIREYSPETMNIVGVSTVHQC